MARGLTFDLDATVNLIPGEGYAEHTAEKVVVNEVKKEIANAVEGEASHAAATTVEQSAKKINLNSNEATSNFGVYEIKVKGDIQKVGKADLNRVTKSSGLPTRIHQQVRKLEEKHEKGNVTAEVVQDLGKTTTRDAKAAEKDHLKKLVDSTGKIPEGNEKSY